MHVVSLSELVSAKFRNKTNQEEQPAILVTVTPSVYSDSEDLKFNYTLVSYDEKSLQI